MNIDFVKTINVNILKLTNAYYIFSSTLIIYINNSVSDEFVVFVGTFSMHLVFRYKLPNLYDYQCNVL